MSLTDQLPRDVRSWLVTFICVAAMYLFVAHGFFFFNGVLQISLFIGILAGMIASTTVQAMVVSVLGLSLMQLMSPPVLVFHETLTPLNWLISLLFVAAASFLTGYVRSRMSGRQKVFSAVVSTLLIAWLVLNFWVPLFAGGGPLSGYATLQASTIRAVPVAHQYVNDDAIYRRVFYLMHDGEPYYQAYRDAWLGLQQGTALPTSITAYRLPTFYWLWSALPRDAFLIVPLFLFFASVGAVAVAFITGQLVGVRFAPLASAALLVYAMGSAISVYVTFIDLPTTCIALIGIALFTRAAIRDDQRYLWAAAAVLTATALTREILAYLIVLAALSALLQPAGSRLRKAVPWLVALGVFAVGYALHAYEVVTLIQGRSAVLNYAGGSPAFAVDALRRFATLFTGADMTLIVLFLLGAAGAWASQRRAGRPFAIFALMAIVLPVLGMMKLGNPGLDAHGLQVNYWGNLVVPTALAFWPVALLLLPEG
jgi:hypothetical protein